jgi:hypothetical protein
VRQIWGEERILEEGKETILVPIHKRGDRGKYDNYRGIALRNAGYKILSITVLGKIKPYIEKNMGDYPNGFRDGRSVKDNIFTLKIINDKIWKYNQSVQYLFIDFQKAYYSIQRDTLWKCMEELTIPQNYHIFPSITRTLCITCTQYFPFSRTFLIDTAHLMYTAHLKIHGIV